jgi:NhaA family Na+:H+ antiporter
MKRTNDWVIKKLTHFFKKFANSERSSGYILVFTTVLSLLLANVLVGVSYTEFFHYSLGPEMLHVHLAIGDWINDALMAVFFLTIGLEIKRELYTGELSNAKKASLPIAAAIGGMSVPFAIYSLVNKDAATQSGFGIPMATDIAFALGALSLVPKVPRALKIFLAAFAIIDDLGAILLIALFYAKDIQLIYLLMAVALFVLLVLLNRLRVNRLWIYLIPALALWYCMLRSGVHATISGVLFAFALPSRGGESSLSSRVLEFLHKPVAFLILPLFALANTGIIFSNNWITGLHSPNSLGIIIGLIIGKPVGILLLSFVMIKTGWSRLPNGVRWRHLVGAGILGGIGFTMSVFITLLAFNNPYLITQSKIAILISSFLASVLGMGLLWTRNK